jgi:dTDP-4-amino-4,6-dideoxygalactose transaminase
MSTNELAIDRGRPEVGTKYRERWRRVRFSDLVRIARYAWRDVNTLAKGEGPIAEFERDFAARCSTKYALAMNSGTAALHSAYFAVGVKPGTEVIVPAYTFFASVAPVLQCGGTPVFCDIDERTLTADPDDVERRITPRTRAICVVHMWGNPARMDRFAEIARRHRVALIEDCSHAHGASYRGRPVGSWGDIGCFSLQGEKAVTGGEAGVAVTSDPTLFDTMLVLGHYGRLKHGQVADTFETDGLAFGLKYRPHLYAMVLACGSLSRLDELNRRRRRNYEILGAELESCPAVRAVGTYPDATRGGFLEFIVKYDPAHAGGWSREQFIKAARAEGVPIARERYAAIGDRGCLLHESRLFAARGLSRFEGRPEVQAPLPGDGRGDDLPVTRSIADRLLTLPPFTKVPERFVRQCARALRKVANGAARSRVVAPEIAGVRVGAPVASDAHG